MISSIILFLFPLILAPGGAGEGCCQKKKVTNTKDGLDGEYSLIEGRDNMNPICASKCVYIKYISTT